MDWDSYRNDDRQEQEELELIRAQIYDATKDTAAWLRTNNLSAEEQVHFLATQAGLADLARIVERRMERRKLPKDEWEYSETVDRVLSRLEKVRQIRGHMLAMGLSRFVNHLPKELPGSKVRFVTRTPAPQPPVETQANHWREFRSEFEQLAREEDGIERAAPKDRLLRAYCDYNAHPEILHEKGKRGQGCFCLLKAPETGLWMYSDGVSENFLERFRALAARAGVYLGFPKRSDPEDYWLHRLYLDLCENNSKSLLCERSQHTNTILRVCEASATFCCRLERRAIEQSEPGNSMGIYRLGTDANQPTAPKPALSQSVAPKLHSTGIIPGQFQGLPHSRAKEELGAPRPKLAKIPPNSPSNGQPGTTNRPDRGGRPRKDDERRKVAELRSQGKTWAQVAIQMNRETNQKKSKDAYRNLLRSDKP